MRADAIRLWFRALFRRARVESEMDKEMRIHLDMETEANIRRGMSPNEARRQARIAFGGVDRHQEDTRDARGTRELEELARDFGYAARSLRKRPGFALLATLTLAIGIGATAGIYTLANWVLYRPIPGVADPDALVIVSFEDSPGQETNFPLAALTIARGVEGFESVLVTSVRQFQFAGQGLTARDVAGAIVGGDYFQTLGVRPARGRFFTTDELAPAFPARVAVISWPMWQSAFGGDSAVLGRQIRLNAVDFTVVGVTPEPFRGFERVGSTEVWVPGGAMPALYHMARDMSLPTTRVFRVMIARMRQGASVTLAQEQITTLARQLHASDPKGYSIVASHPPHIYDDVGTPVFGRRRTTTTLGLLFAIVSVVLLIACANVANLLLIRGLARRPEFAVRKALGASGLQLLRLHTAEGLLIGLTGGVIAVGVAMAVAQLFEGQALFRGAAFEQISIDHRVLAFTFLLAAVTGVAFGLVPAVGTLRHTRVGLENAGDRSTGSKGRLRAVLMLLQVGGSVALVVISMLLGRTLRALGTVDLGIDPVNVTTARLDPAPQGYAAERIAVLRVALAEALRAEDGIESVALSSHGVPQRTPSSIDLRRVDAATDQWPVEGRMDQVGPGYFATLRIPLLAGRDFVRADETDASVPVIVNASAARELFGAANPVGQELVARFGTPVRHRIIGLVADARAARVREPQGAVVYFPIGHGWETAIEIVVRSQRPFADVEAMLRRVVRDLDPSIPLQAPVPVTRIVAASAREERLFLKFVTLLGVLAVTLAAVGLYGVTAYSVAQRRREIGIRIALGAGVRKVVATVTRQSAFIVGAGVAVGLLGAAGFARALQSMLFGVARLDAVSYAGAALVFTVVALLACVVPARSAARVPPTEALRAE
jgi:putative ABC transport system permease protein